MKILSFPKYKIKKYFNKKEKYKGSRKSIQYLGMTAHRATFDDLHHTDDINSNVFRNFNHFVLFASRFQDNDSQKQYMTVFPYCMNEEVIQKIDFSMKTIEALRLMAVFNRLNGKSVGKNVVMKRGPMYDLEMIRDFHPSGTKIVDDLNIGLEDISMGEFALNDLFVCDPDPELVVEADANKVGELLYDVCDCFTSINSVVNQHYIDLISVKNSNNGRGDDAGYRIRQNPLFLSSFSANIAMKPDFLESIR